MRQHSAQPCPRVRSSPILLLPFLLAALAAGPGLLSAATINVPADRSTVRDAVDAAASGDVILIAPGTYDGGVFFDGKALTIASWFLTTGDTTYVATTVVRGVVGNVCRGNSSCVGDAVFELGTNAHGSALIGLTISNGTNGVASRSRVDITNCRILSNGDGLDFNSGSGGTWSNSLFAYNTDDGIDMNGRVDARIINNNVRDNRDDGIEFRLYAHTGALLVTEITGNRFTGNGEDGIQLIDYAGTSNRKFRIERNFFSRNAKAAVGCMPDQNTVEDLSGAPIAEPVVLANNTFVAENYGFVGGAAVVALNNLFVGTRASALRRVAGNSIASYNMFWSNGTDYEASNIDPAHTWNADPRLQADATLGAGSPAIDAGTAFFQWQGETALNLPASAYVGPAPDLGAFETATPQPDPLSITCPGPTTIRCPATPSFGSPTVRGGCSANPSVTFLDATTPGACPQQVVVTRTWTVSDGCGSQASCSQAITIVDDTAPVFSGVGGPKSIECPASRQFDEPVASDACDPSPTVTFADVTTPGSCPQEYSVTRTWTATDACGNSGTATQTVSVRDRTAPVILGAGGPITLECPAVPQFSNPTTSDACDPSPRLTFADVTTPGSCPQSYSVTRTWTATDGCGNTGTASQTVTVADHTAPEISGVGVNQTLECPATPAFANPTARDGCDPSPSLTFEDATTPGACPGAYSSTRTWTATDACGNASTASQTLTVEDHTAPEIDGVGGPEVIECGAAPAFSTPTARDACDPNPGLTFNDVALPGSCPELQRVTRTWTATDACGNSSTASQTVVVEDHGAPVISGVDGPLTVACAATPGFSEPRATDACDPSPGLAFVDVTTPGACPQSYSVTRTWTATDACGNSSSASQTLTVVDDAAPVISGVGGPRTLECPAAPEFGEPSVADACDPSPSLTFVDVTTPGSCPRNYSMTRTWTAIDACGNRSQASQTLTVEDRAAPVISGLGESRTLACPTSPQFDDATASDACDPSPELTFADVTTPGSCPQSYSVTRTWTATDDCGNRSAASQTVTVEDREAPVVVECPADATIQCPATPAFGTPSFADNCGASPSVTFADRGLPATCPAVSVVERTWTARDECGNTTTCRQIITVEDHDAPVITGVGGPATIECPVSPQFSHPDASDTCDPNPNLTFDDVTHPGSYPQEYSVTRTWTATDACGNSSTASQTFTVVDVAAPAISGVGGPSTIECPASPQFGSPSASDACDPGPSLTFVDLTTPGSCPQQYSVTRTWTATDAGGNSTQASQTITVEDHTAPVISGVGGPAVISCPATPQFGDPLVSDGCDPSPILTFVDDASPGTCPQAYSVTRTWTATDACGNSSQAFQTITVVPQQTGTPPVAALRVTPATGNEPLEVVADASGSRDDVAVASYLFDFGDGTVVGPQPGASASHTYAAGRWTAKVTVADGGGATHTVEVPVLVAETPAEPNLVRNSSFESDSAGWRGYPDARLRRVAGGFDGNFALEITATSNNSSRFGVNDSPSWVLHVPASGTRYRFTAWVRSEDGNGEARVQVREYLDDLRMGMTYAEPVRLSAQWQQLTVDYATTSQGSWLDFLVIDYPGKRGEALVLDNASIRIVPGTVAVGGEPELSMASAGGDSLPFRVGLHPSPLKSRGTLNFITSRPGPLRVEILDLAGRRVRQLLNAADAPAGNHRVTIDGAGDNGAPLSPGMYFYRIDAREGATTGRFLIIR